MIKKILFPILLVVGVILGGVAADFLRTKSAGGATDAHAETVDSHGKKAKDDHGKKAKKDSHGKKEAKGGHGKAADDGHGKKKKKKKKKKGGHGEEADDGHGGGSTSAISYMNFKRQFVVPVVKSGKVESLVLLNLNLELNDEAPEDVHTYEPKFRDALMRALLGLSNEGVFSGDLTNIDTYDYLQETLLDATHKVIGAGVKDVLILDLSRQSQH